MIPDSELLRQYAEQRDNAAFAELVRRHIDLVYSVALRQANGDASMAEDVAQAVFTDLARKARHLSNRETLAGWLHTSARFAAGNAVRGEARRRAREHEAVTMHEITSAPDVNWEQLRPLLDESVGRLKEADRDAIVLRFFEGKSHEEIGQILGLSENSANKRVERALEKLREQFARRGVMATSVLLAAAIAENSVQAAPVGLAARVIGPSLNAATAAGVTTGSIFLKILFMSTQAKLLAVAVILVIAVAVTLNWPHTVQPSAVGLPKLSETGPSIAPAPIKPPTSAQVAKPVVTPANPSNSPTPALPVAPAPLATSNGATQFVADPQTDLNAAIATGLHFLVMQDNVSFFKTLIPPEAILLEDKGSTVEDFAAQISKDPRSAQKLSSMLEALSALADLTPQENPVVNRATYHLDPPVGGHKVIIFNKIGGYWYLDGM